MAERGHELSPRFHRLRDPAVQVPEAVRVLLEPQRRAVVADDRVQTEHPGVVRHRLHEPRQRRQPLDPPARIAPFEHLVDQRRVDPVEERQVQQQRAVLVPQVPQQARVAVVREHAPVPREVHVGQRGGAARGVAVDPQRGRPTVRLGLHPVEVGPRQRAAEEAGDLGPREPQVRLGHDDGAAGEDHRGDVDARILAVRQRDPQVVRAVPHQEVDRRDRGAVHQPLHLVEHQQARRAMDLDRPYQQLQLRLDRPRMRRPAAQIVQHAAVQSAAFEGVDEVRAQDVRRVVLVEGEPDGQYAPVPLAVAEVGQQGGLAETAGRLDGDQPGSVPRAGAVEQRRPGKVAVRPGRRGHLRGEQPGQERGHGRSRSPERAIVPAGAGRGGTAFRRPRPGNARAPRRRSGRGCASCGRCAADGSGRRPPSGRGGRRCPGPARRPPTAPGPRSRAA